MAPTATTPPMSGVHLDDGRVPVRAARTGPQVLVAVAPDENDNVLQIGWTRARSLGTDLTVCSVVSDEDERRVAYDRLLERIRQFLPADAAVDVEVRVGDKADEILHCIAERDTRLVVLGECHRGEGVLARLFWPSVPTAVVRGTTCPILVTRHTPGTGRILAATALDAAGFPILRAAAAELERAGGQVTALHCLEPMALVAPVDVPTVLVAPTNDLVNSASAHLMRAASECGLEKATLRVEIASPAEKILEVAKEIAADLIIVGTHGRSGAARLLLGSVAEEVVRDAPCNVLVVHLDDRRAGDADPH